MSAPLPVEGQLLNHVELVFRPGERDVARCTFELFGWRVRDFGGPFLTAQVGPGAEGLVDNVLYASEVVAEQWALEQCLVEALGETDPRRAADEYRSRLAREPQRSFHFGVRTRDRDTFESSLERIRAAGAHDGPLAGRVGVVGVFRPGDPGALSDTMIQAFVHTDVVASGLLVFGQHVELQCHL